ncbi:MAG: DUF4249 family protein [Bacteroidota bacterium]|nr:DUF4249 family protein [Bacteroidota bacterium]
MRIIKKYIYLFAAGLTLSVACKEKIELEIPSAAPLLVVEAEVTTETDSSYVKLHLSSDYFSAAAYPVVKTAQVRVNGISFDFDPIQNLYRPDSGFDGKPDSVYNLQINYEGKTYTSQAKLEPMFSVKSFFNTYKPKEGFLPAGYSVSYVGYDDRPGTKYTYFVGGKYDFVNHVDSFDKNKILFNSAQTPVNRDYQFEIPFTRFDVGDIYTCIFRSVDKNMYDFIEAYNMQSSGAPGPFQVPPANLPTNITGGALGYFATYQVVRIRHMITP